MLTNYIKMAGKVLLRRKFFTFISLFGISFTIMVLLIVTAFIESRVSSDGEMVNRSRILIADRLIGVDSSKTSGTWSSPGFKFLNKYLKNIETPELISIYSHGRDYFTYPNGIKLKLTRKFTDDTFWRIYPFRFIEGKAFGINEYESASRVAVINEYTALAYFGKTNVVGEPIEVGGITYRVIGVVENISVLNRYISSDVYVPTTTAKSNTLDTFFGGFGASILAKEVSDFPVIRNEFHRNLREALKDAPDPSRTHVLKCVLKTYSEMFAKEFYNSSDKLDHQTTLDKTIEEPTGIPASFLIYSGIGFLMILFMLLPSINLVNINLSRMTERNSEIGVRKAFGASKSTLVGQFIVENIILTLIGGVVSAILAALALNAINSSGIIKHVNLTMSFSMLIISVIICMIFGIMSGAYPAYRMSKLHPVEALRGGTNV